MALIALLAVAVLVFAYVLTSRLNSASRFVGIDREHNALVLARAKQALIGYMAHEAATGDDPGTTGVVEGRNPGSLPCPEAPGYYGDPAQEGIAAGNCTLPAVGRLPWRTLGLERLVDSAAEPLWYVVSTGWALPCGTCSTQINSDSPGQLALDGVANDAVALIIAPGAALSVQAGAGCTAWSQARPTTGLPDLRNYLECGNASGNYVTSAPGRTFNDQVLRVSAADVMPALEAAVAERMQREIAPTLRGVYASTPWKRNSTTFLVSTNPLYPFAAPFANPGTSSHQGALNRYQGLMPLTHSETSPGSGMPCAADPRCNPLFVVWTGGTLSGPSIHSPSCTVVTGTTSRLDCTFYYTCSLLFCTPPTLNYTIQAQASNVAMALRQINMSAPIGSANVTATLTGAQAVLNSNGSASLTLTGTATPDGSGGFLSALLGNTFCGLPLIGPVLGCKPSLISVPIGVLADHPLLDAGNATTGWFVRNRWHQVVYYAAAQASTPNGLPSHGCDSSDCLRFNDGSTRNIRALLVLAGRSMSNAPRPGAVLSDYVEYQNCDFNGGLGDCDPQTLFEQRPKRASKVAVTSINAPFNDRVVLVDWNSALLVPTQALTTAPLRTATLP